MRRVLTGLVAALLAGVVVRAASGEGVPGDFDFYVLALSWSPSYCLIEGSPDDAQCAVARQGFIVHGLWPEYETGYPEYCDSPMSDWVSNDIADAIFDLVPSPGLVGHQWRKHGICSGLTQEAYFDTMRSAFETISIPDALIAPRNHRSLDPAAIEEAFLDANPGLSRRGIAVTCRQGHLADVRICLSRDLEYRECREVDRDGCRASRIKVPPVD